MTTVLAAGKYRSKKDWSTSSIPTLVSLEEESTTPTEEKPDNGIPPKPPRRSSLAMGLLGLSPTVSNNNVEKPSKRRSSIAVAFLGRRESGQKNKDQFGEMPSIGRLKSDGDNGVINSENGDHLHPDFPGRRHRRSSWQAKFERRRRKVGLPPTVDDNEIGADDGAPMGYGGRQKRHSWWNILKPENLKQRSRRSSQADVDILSRTGGPVFRSKSRSVDHGLAPFDLDSLKSKVEGRIDSVERLSRDAEKKKAPPIPTTTYTVGDRDTLTSVAARFDTTPSELSKLNRLVSSFIYPGQQLLVPDKSAIVESGEGSTTSGKSSPTGKSTDDLHEEKELLDGLRPGSPKPGHIERVSSPNVHGHHHEDDPVITQRFLKINVRHITDGQGVVGGVLLVTPNAVMFDPNVSDPLVIEHGPESYGVIAPMDLVVNAAIFHDIAHMRVGNEANNEKPEVYYPKLHVNRYENTHSPGKDSLLVKDETFPELGVGSVEGCDDQESVCSSNGREGDAFPKAFDRDLVTPTNLQHAEQLAEFRGGARESVNKTLSTESAAATEAKEAKPDGQKDGAREGDDKALDTMTSEMRSLEERRKSMLDQHWAIPSKDSQRSQEDEEEDLAEESLETVASMPQAPPVISQPYDEADDQQLVKLSCHDSGIDIRDPNSLPLPGVQQIPAKKVYSDADIVLSSDWVPPLTIAPSHFTDSPPKSGQMVLSAQSVAQSNNLDQGGRKKTSSVSFSVEDSEHQATDKTGDKKNKMLKRLSYPLAWVEGLTGEGNKSESIESAPNTGDSSQSVFSKVFSRRSSIGTFIRPSPSSSESSHPSSHKSSKAPPPKLDYRSMVSIDDMPELFVSFDKLIPRPARACPDPPLYLRLRMGRPLGKSVPLPTSVMSYGKNKLRPEYWFSIPKNRVDELFRFLNSWVPHLYGELNEEKVTERGYELIQHDTEWAQGGVSKEGRVNSDGEDIAELTRESWELLKAPYVKIFNIIKSQTGSNDLEGVEVLSMSADDYRKSALFPSGSFDLDFPIPDLVGQTEILTEEHREKLCGHLPARAEGYSWSLVFSTSQHGFSINSLYRKMHRLESPVLIVIQDTGNNVFGALTSCSLHVSDHFYGTGESLLYKFNPSFKVFHWTGENMYFIKGNPESLSIGAGDGIFGLWLDGDLNLGRSQHCTTYGNEPLAPQEDFVVKTLECWAFV